MPIRIYALAKDLKYDSKDLVELCLKAGITGKGSALASLEDDEVIKLKAYLAGPTKKPVAGKADGAGPSVGAPMRPSSEPAPFTREDYLPPVAAASSKIKVLVGKPKKPAVEPKPDIVPDAVPEPPVQPAAASPPPAPTIKPLAVPAADLEPQRPERPKPGPPPKPEPPRSAPQRRREPVIVLSKLPEVKQPVMGTSRSNEPAAQKPEIRLPKDAIRGAKAGARPPLEHLTAHAQRNKLKPGGDKPGGPKRPDGPHVVEAPLSKAASRTRKHKDGTPFSGPPEAEKELAGMASARADRQKARKARQKGPLTAAEIEEESLANRKRSRLIRRGRGASTSTAAPRKERVSLALPCNIRSFSEAAGVATGQLLKTLMTLGHPVNINAMIDHELAELLAAELGLDIELKARESLESTVLAKLQANDEDPALLETRPPVVTFLGHVDHGKTSLLDRIIGINVASKEAGGITQQIRAYQINKNGRKISFVDTPGHEAFTEMRARGANVTDIAVLVVAADDGVMPQTEEAISHAKAANVPIVVALNKIDLPGANADRVLQQLSAQGLTPSEWSGDVEVMRCSALTGEGMDDLLETLLVTADIHDYKANPNRPAAGTCLEAEQESGRGVIAKVMVKNGTLNVGDIIVCGPSHGRVKAMYDTLKPHVKVKKAGPSMPVNITGLDVPPNAGDSFFVLNDITQARQIAAQRATAGREQSLSGQTTKVSFDQFQKLLTEGRVGKRADVATLNLIIRADMRGSIEAILSELGKFDHPEVQVKVLQASVGGITVADVTLAYASNAVIVGFNVIPDEAARSLAEERQIEIRRYDIIYKVADDIKAILEGKLKPEERVLELGQALVKQTFTISRVGTVAGCYVTRGTIERGCKIRVFRDGRVIGEYPMESLRREKDDIKEVARGMECGIRLTNFHDVKQNDVLEAYKIEEVARTL